MKLMTCLVLALLCAECGAWAADLKVAVRFQAMVGSEKFACGHSYSGIGTTASTLSPRDFRFYVHNAALVDDAGKSAPLQLDQDGKWQLDDVVLLDFEDATGGCVNGTPDTNDRVTGTIPEGHYTGLRFTLGVPFNKNYTDLTTQPSPLNLTALAWVWNAGRKFARLDFSSTGMPRGYAVHLGSTGCTPNQIRRPLRRRRAARRIGSTLNWRALTHRPTLWSPIWRFCSRTRRSSTNQEKTPAGCMSGPDDSDCAPAIRQSAGLPFAGKPAGKQLFFRKGALPGGKSTSGAGN